MYTVAVRALCEFTAKHGDLDLRFTPSPSAQEGLAGHALVASRRAASYQREVGLAGDYRNLRVKGRADGYDPELNQLEEVKTYRGDLHAIADNRRNLHWAQAKIYGWLLCQEKSLPHITLALVYFDIASAQETPLVQHCTASELRVFFEAQCERFLAWASQEAAHREARNTALKRLPFPHADFRPGQRDLSEAVYKTAKAGRCLMAQATTGIGKTVGTIFPLLKAAPTERLDKLFFLAAKTPGRQLALEALGCIQQADPALPLRVLELVARDKACEHPDKACHGDSCPLAKGFYDRLGAARAAAVAATTDAMLDRANLRSIALAHRVCPYYLSQELVRWCDVVVGDYNYYFDASALLFNLAQAEQWRVSVLVDEAHNLIDRGRKMYSASLDQALLHQLHAAAPVAVKKPLEKLHRALNDTHRTQTQTYQTQSELPGTLVKALQQAVTAMTDFWLANPTRVDTELQNFYFDVLHFSRLAEQFGAHSIFDITLDDGADETAQPRATSAQAALAGAGPGSAVLTLRNVVPAPFLSPRFAAAQSVVLFSATLSPQRFYRDTLGLPANAAWLDVLSPFKAEQLRVAAVRNISTRFQHRDQSLPAIADLMARQYASAPGNYLAFLSSFDYLKQLSGVFRQRHGQVPCWTQTRQMDEGSRDSFLRRFQPDSRGIGFAVLGGAFAEGIDLPGKRLIGAFIATLGMPQVNPVNEEIRLRMARYFDDSSPADKASTDGQNGYNYTYLYPGLQKVVQAAGRVIRSPTDTGVIYLMDDRFTRPEVLALLPAWWAVEQVVEAPAQPKKPILQPPQKGFESAA